MKTIAQKVAELLEAGQPVRSQILGCMGEVEKVIDNNFICLKRRKYKRHGGGFTMNERLNHPHFRLKKIKGHWILGNRRTHSQRLARKSKPGALGSVFKNWGI